VKLKIAFLHNEAEDIFATTFAQKM